MSLGLFFLLEKNVKKGSLCFYIHRGNRNRRESEFVSDGRRQTVSKCVSVCLCVSVCVCVREREREAN